jgi:hypothetical protein
MQYVKSAGTVRAAAVLALCLTAVGCGGTGISKANYDKISTGMSVKDVEGILGKGSEEAGADLSKLVPDFKVPGDKDGKGEAPFGIDVGGMVKNMMNQKVIKWGDDKKFIVVVFIGDKVVAKNQQGL